MSFMQPLWLAALLLLPLPWFMLRRQTYLQHSNAALAGRTTGFSWLRRVPLIMATLALSSFIVALARPQEKHDSPNNIIQSRDIIMAVDISGSMAMLFKGEIPPPETGNSDLDKQLPGVKDLRDQKAKNAGRYDERGKRRIDAAQSAILRFIRARYLRAQGDRIGIEVFDTEPRWSWPLTDDLKAIYRKGLFVDEGLGGGTNFGNLEPGPIDAAATHFDERGQAAAKVLIMVTDCEDSLHSSAFSRLAQKMQDGNIRLYVITVGDEHARGGSQDIVKLAESANGGMGFRADNAAEMALCFDTIDQLERTPVEVSTQPGYVDIFERFAVPALGLFVLALLLEGLFMTR